MLKVGVFAPYNRSDTTWAAVQLSDWLVALGFNVSILSNTPVRLGVHPVWDIKVLRYDRTDPLEWARGCTHFCWFVPDYRTFAYIVTNRSNTGQEATKYPHFFFPGWYHEGEDYEQFCMGMQRIICLSHDMYAFQIVKHPKNKSRLTWTNLVAPEKLLIGKVGLMDKSKFDLFMWVDKTTEMDIGLELYEGMDYLLGKFKQLGLTVATASSFPRGHREYFKKLKRTYGDRFNVHKGVELHQTQLMARSHDLTYVAVTRFRYGAVLAALVASGTPVICHALLPSDAHVEHDMNGWQIPCQQRWSHTAIAEVDVVDVAVKLEKIIQTPLPSINRLQRNTAKMLEYKTRGFKEFLLEAFLT